MTLFSLARKNIKGNFNNYIVYFVSLVFSMVIYYTFVSLQYSEEIQKSILLSDTMNFMFLASSVVLIIFVTVFILYSNSFFTRQRKREVGLYSMLGLRKKTIGKMLFYENFIMGIIALIIGIVLGTLISKLFSMILINLMGSTVEISFGLSFEAIIQTALVFMVIILFTSIQGYRLVYRFKLIELFHAEKKGEEIPKVSPISTAIGLILLVVSYWLILRPFPEKLTMEYIQLNYGFALVSLIIGSQFFFRSVTVYLLKLSQKNKSRYYRGTNLIETAQHLHRIKGNARTFTMIALSSAFTISLFGATYGGYYGNEKQAVEDAAFSYSHLSKGEDFDTNIENIIKNDKNHPIKAQLDLPVIEVKGKPLFQLDYLTEPIKLIPESSFNQASIALDRKVRVSLSGNEAAVIKPRATEFTEKEFKGQEVALQDPHSNQNLIFTKMIEGSLLPFDYPDFFVVVSDEVFDGIAKQVTPLTYKLYEVENEKTTEETAIKIDKLTGNDFQASSAFFIEYKEGKEGNALNLFILGFLGLVFLVATGSILYFKQLTEANEVKPNYAIIGKIGVGKRQIRKSIGKQMLFVFGLPLMIGILHGSAILHFVSNFMSNLIGANMFVPMLTAMAAFVLIYVAYYVLTVNTYNKIVNK
ncbi:ABC transporter permease [Rossellomorea oryzaecorticis]|uniref:ABC transporter permease n=1 Tax=Rossellomorea oryzaecorticis TaxID=1396505 RepID=A0ABW8VVK1_9BACI